MQSEAGLVALILTGQIFDAAAGCRRQRSAMSWVRWSTGCSASASSAFAIKPVVSGRADASLDRAQRWYRRYGKWSLLASWVPIIGDPITVVAGVMKEPLPTFLVLVTIAKTARYAVLAVVTAGVCRLTIQPDFLARDLREVGNRAGRFADQAQQRQAVGADGRILVVDENVGEEAIDRAHAASRALPSPSGSLPSRSPPTPRRTPW
jgi:membrane protein YqaA with SNARE-associated domain